MRQVEGRTVESARRRASDTLWVTLTEKGIGRLLGPWQIRREGRARIALRREARLALAQAERDAEDIRAGRKELGKRGSLLLPTSQASVPDGIEFDVHSLAEVAAERLVAETIRGEVSVARAILHAEEELEPDSRPAPERAPDTEWLYRWRENAASVTTEDLQHMWGQVLAGEIKSPGAFSLRTLEFLRHLSVHEAQVIVKACALVFDKFIYAIDDAVLEALGLDFDGMQLLRELGIVDQTGGFVVAMTYDSDSQTTFTGRLTCHDTTIEITHPDPKKRLQLPAYPVTTLGREVLRLGTYEDES